MRIGNVILDTDNMTYEEVDQLVQELREIRKRKREARECKLLIDNAVAEAKQYGFRYVNRHTGEIFDENDWLVYDEKQNCTHGGR